METATSADGTVIAYERVGEGPPLIVSVGAFCTRRTFVAQLGDGAHSRRSIADWPIGGPPIAARLIGSVVVGSSALVLRRWLIRDG